MVVATLRVSLEDQGRLVCCHAEQWDNSQPRISLDTREEVRQSATLLATNKQNGK